MTILMISIKSVNEVVSAKKVQLIHACFHGTVGTRERPQSDCHSRVNDESPLFISLQGYAYVSKLLPKFRVAGKQRLKRCLFRKESSDGLY